MINLTVTDSQVENYLTPTTVPPSLTLLYSQGSTRITLVHDALNAIRAYMMWSIDYPRTIILPHVTGLVLNIPNATVDYQGYGGMKYNDSRLTISFNKTSFDRLSMIISGFNFDVSQYEDGDDREDPYYYYVNQDSISLNMNMRQIANACEKMNIIFPYERFERINQGIYKYITGGSL